MTNFRKFFFSACIATLTLLSTTTLSLSGELDTYSDAAWDQTTTPNMVVVVQENCTKCAELQASLEKLADKFPGYRFFKASPDTALVKPEKLPMIAIRVPGKKDHISIIPAYKASTSPEYLATLLDLRIKAAKQEDVLYQDYVKAREEYKLKRKPYEELADQFEALADKATADEAARKEIARRKWREAQDRIDEQMNSLSGLK